MLTSSRLRLSFRHFVNGRMGDMSCKAKLPTPETALPGRSDSIEVAGMRQGNDVGTTYRSAIYTYTQQQLEEALASRDGYQKVLTESGFGPVTTEIAEAQPFYYAEDYHQQYLNKVPDGYCGLKGTGVSCPKAITG